MAINKRSRERIQWADEDKHREKLRVIGRGEGLKTVYFGAGFSSPPDFDFSAVIDAPERNVVPHVVVQPRGSLDRDQDQNGLGNDSQSAWNGYIADPSFEVQSQFASQSPSHARQIPGVEAVRKMIINNRDYDPGDAGFQRMPVAQDWADGVDWLSDIGSRQPSYWWNLQGPHFWLQTGEERNLWSTTNVQSHDLGVGEAGKYSATAVIGPSGYTNWLIPIGEEWFFPFPTDGYLSSSGTNFFDINDPLYAEHMFYSVREWTGHKWVWDEFDQMSAVSNTPPPYIGGFEGFAYVKSASDCTLETQAVFHHWEGGQADDGQNEVVFADDKIVGLWAPAWWEQYYGPTAEPSMYMDKRLWTIYKDPAKASTADINLLIDGSYAYSWNSSPWGIDWLGTVHQLDIDLGRSLPVSRITWGQSDPVNYPDKFSIYASDDGLSWDLVQSFTDIPYDGPENGDITFTEQTHQHWRIQEDGVVSGGNGAASWIVNEFDFFGRQPDASTASYRVIATVDDATAVTGGDWSRIPISLPYEGERPYPEQVDESDGNDHPLNATGPGLPSYGYTRYRWTHPTISGGYGWPFWRLKFRVKGTPGETVYLDNVYLYKEIRNAQAPHITVGVAEWIKDDAGVYIGAILWFKMGTP